MPAPISGVSDVASVAAGFRHTLALRRDGAVFAWGLDTYGDGYEGALGVGNLLSETGEADSPVQTWIPAGTIIVAIAAGNGFSLAVDTTGLVWGWGDNSDGQIGIGMGAGTNLPTLVQGISNVVAVAAGSGYQTSGGGDSHSIALTSDGKVWTWGSDSSGQLGRSASQFYPNPTPAPVTNLTNVVAIAGGVGFTLAVTSNGQVYAFGDNTFGELGTSTSAVAYTNRPMLVAGISNAVLVSAPRLDDGFDCVSATNGNYNGGVHAMVMTVDQGTNHYWGWGDNTYGQVGNGTNGGGTNQISQYAPAGPVQFCTRCQRHIQLGTSGIFTAQCNGTLYLYFNDEQGHFDDNSGSYTVTVNNVTNTVPALDPSGYSAGVAFGTVTFGGTYTFRASGLCNWRFGCDTCVADPNGPTNGTVDCSSINITNAVCPAAKCFSLVGRIQ